MTDQAETANVAKFLRLFTQIAVKLGRVKSVNEFDNINIEELEQETLPSHKVLFVNYQRSVASVENDIMYLVALICDEANLDELAEKINNISVEKKNLFEQFFTFPENTQSSMTPDEAYCIISRLVSENVKINCYYWYKMVKFLYEKLIILQDIDFEKTDEHAHSDVSPVQILFSMAVRCANNYKPVEQKDVKSNLPSSRIFSRYVDPNEATGFVAKAFNAGYLDANDDLLQEWLTYGDSIAEQSRADNYHSPSVPIIQRSSTGKSRLMKQTSEHRWVIYFCLGNDYSMYPPRTAEVENLLLGRDWNLGRMIFVKYVTLIMASYELLTEYITNLEGEIGSNPQTQWFQYQIAPDSDFFAKLKTKQEATEIKLYIKLAEIIQDKTNNSGDWAQKIKAGRLNEIFVDLLDAATRATIGLAINEVFTSIFRNYLQAAQTIVLNPSKGCQNCQYEGTCCNSCRISRSIVYFTFDEAGELAKKKVQEKTYLELLRDASSFKYDYGAAVRFLIVFVDARLDICNFVPSEDKVIRSTYKFSNSSILNTPYWSVSLADLVFNHCAKLVKPSLNVVSGEEYSSKKLTDVVLAKARLGDVIAFNQILSLTAKEKRKVFIESAKRIGLIYVHSRSKLGDGYTWLDSFSDGTVVVQAHYNIALIVACYGFPVWAAYIQSLEGSKRPIFPNINIFAQTKIAKTDKCNIESDETNFVAVSMVASKYHLHEIKNIHYCQKLISGYMGTLVLADANRQILRCIYPAEPMLTEGVSSFIHKAKTENPTWLATMISSISALTNDGIVEPGERGEFISRFLLVNAMDDACYRLFRLTHELPPSIRVVPVLEYLSYLLVTKDENENLDPPHVTAKKLYDIMKASPNVETDADYQANIDLFLQGVVCFNHSRKIGKWFHEMDLEECFTRCMLYQCRDYQVGIDEFASVLLPNGETTFFATQIKDYSNPVSSMKTAAYDITAERIGFTKDLPYLILYISYFSPTEKQNISFRTKKRKINQENIVNLKNVAIENYFTENPVKLAAPSAAESVDRSAALASTSTSTVKRTATSNVQKLSTKVKQAKSPAVDSSNTIVAGGRPLRACKMKNVASSSTAQMAKKLGKEKEKETISSKLAAPNFCKNQIILGINGLESYRALREDSNLLKAVSDCLRTTRDLVAEVQNNTTKNKQICIKLAKSCWDIARIPESGLPKIEGGVNTPLEQDSSLPERRNRQRSNIWGEINFTPVKQ